MTLDEIERLLREARQRVGHTDYVIVGSLAVLGVITDPPDSMVMSVDVDLYIKADPGRTGELKFSLGQGSEFEEEWGYYLDPVSPQLPSFPEGWNERLIRHDFGDVSAHFVSPNDIAVSKYIRGEPRDLRWLKVGLRIGLLDLDVIERMVGSAPALEGEASAARRLIKRHRLWLKTMGVIPRAAR